jgi:hypothetical protein
VKAPTEKANDTIQIVISRACDLFWCSNCTQLLPFRRDAVHMAPDVFRLALRSLEGWPGIRGVFGGNPCMHPQFPDLMAVLREEVPDQRQRGIWTNDLRQHGPLVRDVFFPRGRFNLNAHANPGAAAVMDRYLPGKVIPSSRTRPSWHAPILLDWRDVGLTPAEWTEAREACDINRTWSAAICERDGAPFAYFCEVGAALDGIRNENHGIPAVPGWWRNRMDGFGDQVAKCCDAGCGVPLRRLGHLDTAATYDYSAAFIPLIAGRLRSGKVAGVPHGDLETLEATARPTDYQGLRSEKP